MVWPLHAIVPPTDPAEVLRAAFDRQTGTDSMPPPLPLLPSATDPLGYGPVAEELNFGRLDLVWAFATAYADPPQRLKGIGASYANVPATLIAYFLVTDVYALLWAGGAGLLGQAAWPLIGLTLPFSLIGITLGQKLYRDLDESRLRRLIRTLLALLGALGVARAGWRLAG